MKKNVTYIISNINKALAFEWIETYLDPEKFNLNFILLNPGDSDLETYLKQKGVVVNRIPYTGKRDIPRALVATCRILRKSRTHVLHAHLFDANLIGLTAAALMRVRQRIYTRHHSTYCHDYFPRMVKFDKLCNFLATDIVAISKNVLDVLRVREKVPARKLHLIHHGFKLDSFENISPGQIEALRQKYEVTGYPDQYPVIGVISRYTEWKGIQFIIPAFKKLLEEYPRAILFLANAHGNYARELKELLKTLPATSYKEIDFENDIFSLYRLFDIFVHVPINSHAEAFGQIYVEALAAGVPAVFTLSGIASEFIEDGRNALVVDYNSSDSIYSAVTRLLNDREVAERIAMQGKKDVFQQFELAVMIQKLEQLYLS